MNIPDERARVVAEAMSWLGTPYHDLGRVKGRNGGVDCAMLLVEVFSRAGIIVPFEPPHYAPDHMMHARAELMLPIVESFAHEVGDPLPGDVALYKIGRIFGHAAIVLPPGWPMMMHANKPARSVVLGRGDEGRLAACKVKFYSRW